MRLLALFACLAALSAADWPNYRGPTHDQRSAETGILTTWPAGGPKQIWRSKLGEGFGAISIAKGKAFVMVERDKQEACVCLDAASGQEAWGTTLGKTIFEGAGGNGPRSTPFVDGDRVYCLGTYLMLSCLDAATGKVVWQHDLATDHSGQLTAPGIKQWGNAASPIVEGGVVVVAGGGSGKAIMAFDKVTGNLAWAKYDDKITHATATPATLGGQRQLIFFTQSGLLSVDGAGAVVWRQSFPFSTSTAASPVVAGEAVFCSAGYGVGGGAYRVAGGKSSELWRTPGKTICHWTTPVHHDGHVYGMFGFKEYKSEPLKCVEVATGKEVWSKSGFGQGGLIFVDGNLMVMTDFGELVLVKASPKAYEEVARAQVLTGKCWTMPVIADGRVYCRSVKEAVCVDLRK